MNHMVGVGQKFGVDGRSSSYGKATFDGTDGIESFPGVSAINLLICDFRKDDVGFVVLIFSTLTTHFF